MRATFRSLGTFNYRTWAMGAFVSNVGTWMQRTAQDWMVLTQLTDHSAHALGVVMALQFGPQILLLPLTGSAVDHFDRRKLLLATQSAMGLLALGLGVLTLTGSVALWHVYLFALGLGCVAAFDAPARQAFVSELVGEAELPNAVGLNSSSFNAARMVGPAVAGVLIALIGTGWVFILNAFSFAAVLGSLLALRVGELHRGDHPPHVRGGLMEGLSYVWRRKDLRTILVMVFLIGTFGLNFPIFISTMAVSVFRSDASEYGLLTSLMAVGSLTGALFAAGHAKPHLQILVGSSAAFGLALLVAAFMPSYWLFGLMLVFVGVSGQMFTTMMISTVQLSTDAHIRGRVMAILIATAMGGTPIGAPVLGWVADHWGARQTLIVGAASGLVAAVVGLHYLAKSRRCASPK